ncbi:hypothetical protein NQ314_003264 [Rhamnusium bicolor]|uniref:Uncharacterized protein n=1 Tax=Rhamnusium bicolor TaxID=1586634 RepID=A0AAV8ZNQ5_9CUCU|nr:hypothetical protein NQ314_003264 [Rhamnusium bicolor]
MGEEGEAPPEEPPEEEEAPPKPEPPKFSQDPLHTEFLYYSSVLRILGPTLTAENDRRLKKETAYLSTSLLLDEAIGIFRQYPPDGAIPDLKELVARPVQAAEWETDPTWQDTLVGLPDDFQMLECCIHATPAECNNDHNLDKPLAEAAKAAAENKPILDPTGCEANEFLMNQPMPDDGAFCYIALTGDLVATNLITN